MIDAVWISWEKDGSIRSKVLAKEMNAYLSIHSRCEGYARLRVFRYFLAAFGTVHCIIMKKPRVIVAQCPSIILVFLLTCLRRMIRFRFVIDLHSLIVDREGIVNRLLFFCLLRADVVIVTNVTYRNKIASKLGNVKNIMILPDKIPVIDRASERKLLIGVYNVLYTGGFSSLDPGDELLLAAKSLPETYHVYVTGKRRSALIELPSNCTYTGYLTSIEYQSLLRSVDVVVILTRNEYSLVCGGYEALAAGKPMVLSDTPVLRAYFDKGVVYTKNDASHIAEAIKSAISSKAILESEIFEDIQKKNREWGRNWRELMTRIAA